VGLLKTLLKLENARKLLLFVRSNRKKKPNERRLLNKQRQNAKKKAKEAATTINPVGFLQKPLQFITQSEDIPKPLKGTPFEAPAEFIQEGVKVIRKGILSVPEGVLNVGHQAVLDLTVNRNREKDEYIRAAYDFGINPKTDIGKTSAKILGFIIGTRVAGKALGPVGKIGTAPVPKGLTGGAKLAAQARKLVTDGLIPGAVADFILTDPKDGNLSNAIQNLVPK
jgi:hypothetical protein